MCARAWFRITKCIPFTSSRQPERIPTEPEGETGTGRVQLRRCFASTGFAGRGEIR